MTGEIYRAEMKDGKIHFNFRSGQSRILQTYNSHMTALVDKMAKPSRPMEVDLTDYPWQLSFIESTPAIDRTISLKRITPWTALGDNELDKMMGTGVYTTTFSLKKNDLEGDWFIELGDVRESARVYLNDKFVGCAWSAPFSLNCSNLLRKGKNTLRIEVTNLPANRIADLDRKGVKWRKFNEINIVDINYKKNTYENWETVPSGLNSTVKLIRK
ncbi:MAG: hypothetical protein K2M76_02390 [Muribaculaceae bacterium]|nr:hypothetical protein [Muribaculaceae bacterium]